MDGNQIQVPLPRRYRFHFVLEDPVRLPSYTGSTWRGLMGHGLRRVACVTGQKQCGGCRLLDSCIYSTLFESQSSQADAGRHRVRPHPYVLEPELSPSRQMEQGERLQLGITLVGKAERALPYLVEGFRQGGRRGLGRQNSRFRLDGLYQESRLGSEDWRPILDASLEHLLPLEVPCPTPPRQPAKLRVELLTPLRMKRHGRLVTPRTFEAADFLRQLWRRVHEMSHFHAGSETDLTLALPDEKPNHIKVSQKRLQWLDWTRYSSRQGCRMQMGGLSGSWTIDADAIEPWWPLLWYGQWLHLGKATSMGLGHYRLHSDDKLADTEIKASPL